MAIFIHGHQQWWLMVAIHHHVHCLPSLSSVVVIVICCGLKIVWSVNWQCLSCKAWLGTMNDSLLAHKHPFGHYHMG
jgi:hypothetical protein